MTHAATHSVTQLHTQPHTRTHRLVTANTPLAVARPLAHARSFCCLCVCVCPLNFVCQKSIGQFLTTEKARLPVLCPRANGTSSTHVLTALSIEGVRRLLRNSKSPLAAHVMKFLLGHLKNLEGIIRESKVNPSLQQSYYATVTGQLHGNEGAKTTAGRAPGATLGEEEGAGPMDEDDGGEGTDG